MIQILFRLFFLFVNLRSLFGAANLIRLKPGKEKKRKRKQLSIWLSHINCFWYEQKNILAKLNLKKKHK